MTQINELLSSLCPNGVEYKPIKAIATIKNGKDYKSLEKGDVPVYGSGGAMGVFVNQASHTGPTVLLPRKGSVSNVFYVDGPIWNVDTVFYTEIDEKHMLPRFFYHVMLNVHIEELATNSAARPSLTQSELYRIVVPVPPLEVQREIVRILDSFVELEARRMQYAYYRHQLLSRDNLKQLTGSNVDFCHLGDLCDTLTGYPFKSAEFQNEGILVVRGMNVKRGVLDFSPANNRYWQSSHELEHYLLQRNDIIVAMDGSLVGKSLGIFDGEKQALLGQRLTRIRCNSRTCISSYIFNCLSDGLLTEMTEQRKTSGAVPHISLKDIQSIEVPIPPLPVQQRVVDVLDRFDVLTSSLTDGLPDEIEARRRQYEFYRDRLLDFPRKEADS